MVPSTRRTKRAATNDPEAARSDDESSPEPERVYPTDYHFSTREEYHDFFTQLARLSTGAMFQRGDPPFMHEEFKLLHVLLMSWTWTYGAEEDPNHRLTEPGHLSKEACHLSKDDKQEIIASLKGQCVQEDWDSIKALCPPAARRSLCTVLLEAMLYQFIFVTLLDSPFWFMDGRIDPTDVDGDPQFHKRFQHLYERIRVRNSFGAAWIKSAVIGESNESIYGGTREEVEFAKCNLARRQAFVEQSRDELLGRRVFQLLLRPVEGEDIVLRRDGLQRVLQKAVDTIIYTEGGFCGNSVIHRLPDLPVFQYDSEIMVGHSYHGCDRYRTPDWAPAPGGRVLIVTRPGLTYVDIETYGRVGRVPPHRMVQAEVIAEVIKKKPTSGKSKSKRKPKTARKNKSRKHPKADPQSSCIPENSQSASPSQFASAAEAEDDTTEGEKDVPLGELMPPLRESFWRQ
ncbi:hypothetical protein ASPBRDRAFT_654738 [Aspergillus brasiliensis CBS 101740]|uniref:Uncharacterized protein n=1 Tax=Aspergillus brasiliensis (strain CBS 101740 / IMI 381727 / IBT 21946) TaxID=767769 RepID=A0A1L9V0C4_ASPBC|nr:hypothetical protein ASPBRDRAFT_654738 [Aspergillus brasiliensis CBS 101740]